MEKLICEGNEIEIKDYLEEKGMYALDINFNIKDDFDKFLTVYDEHRFGKGIFRFEIGGEPFDGWFGALKYDKNYSVRVYAIVYDGMEETKDRREGEIYSIEKSIIGIGNAIRELCAVLKKNDALSKEESNQIIEKMNTPETLEEFFCMVDDLPMYLEERNESMEDFRKQY